MNLHLYKPLFTCLGTNSVYLVLTKLQNISVTLIMLKEKCIPDQVQHNINNTGGKLHCNMQNGNQVPGFHKEEISAYY